ncbi:MAG: nucleoside monophosphate kinase, partial [Actinomycetota bacterium]
MHLVIFGPQGAGKGTQSARISEKFGISSIATGDIFRWAIRSDTELGTKVAEYVEAGNLVPDELTISVVQERLEAEPNGYHGGWVREARPGSRYRFRLDGGDA